ncbi:DUF2635 domain-containing protein [Luteibacter aegosomaticola]|uniref:DUF2635 domain-containing protein n=1 Tax=Luteibacter aegosomaticola TaxID=2911538 RepID=UPI001FF73519|nr:DUF2635 domain-containing protein [Luteibacter aegosomaticola]UPG89270.1 DUF2635 domain-containing protein [Luteibacter aegosomaticola]
MRVFPKPGVLVRDPVKRDFLPEEGRDVGDADAYWLRRISDGDVTTDDPNASKARTPKGASSQATTTETRSQDA